MRNKLYLTICLAGLASTPAVANDFFYNSVKAGLVAFHVNDLEEATPTGFTVSGKVSFTKSVYAFAAYDKADDDYIGRNLEFTRNRVGVGYRQPLTNVIDMYLEAGWEDQSVEIGQEFSSSGHRVNLGFAGSVSANAVLVFEVLQVNLDESEYGVAAEAQYMFNNAAGFGIRVENIDETTLTSAYISYSF